MTSPQPDWQFTGEYFENCNCDVVCPCVFSALPQLTAQPTQGFCDVAMGFHIERGSYGATALDGLNVAVIAHTPGPMAEGNWTLALYIDEHGDAAQRAALQAIFSGGAGGMIGEFVPLIGSVLGIKTVPITFTKEGNQRTLVIPSIMQMGVHAAPGAVPDTPMVAVNAHSFNLEGVVIAVGNAGSTYSDYGLRWDNSGKNGHYAPIAWSNAA